MKVPLASTTLREKDIAAINTVLESGNLTMGERVKEFEKAMANYLGFEHFIMVNSGSSANLAMVETLLRPTNSKPKLLPGDRVLVPAIAWPTTIWPLVQLGLKPTFVDVNLDDFAIDFSAAQEVIDSFQGSVKGIFPIHPLGASINRSMLEKFAQVNSLVLINDVCESLGSFSEGHHAGNVGSAASFSFYFSHHITTMEGGGVATNDTGMADDLRSIRSHGWSRDRSDKLVWERGVSTVDSKFLFVSTGYNIRPMEIQGALGLSQLEDLPDFLKIRREIAVRVSNIVKGSRLELVGSTKLNATEEKSHSWMLLPFLLRGSGASEMRKIAVSYLNEAGIETRPVLTGNFLGQPSLRRISTDFPSPKSFTNATTISENGFLVGAHHDMTKNQMELLEISFEKLVSILD